MPAQRQLLLATILTTLLHFGAVNADGYHYDAPTRGPPVTHATHHFAPLPTIIPLPPVPALPALPTPRSHVTAPGPALVQQTHTQRLVQVHPPTPLRPTPAPHKSIAAAYLPPSRSAAAFNNFVPIVPTQQQLYAQRNAQQQQQQQAQQQQQQRQQQRQPQQQQQQLQGFGTRFGAAPTAPFAGYEPTPLSGPSAGDSSFYVANGRQLRQYAVVEIIDNDIEQAMQPFLPSGFFDSYRAHIGASGTGATPPSSGQQINSRANALVQEQQQPRQQQQQLRQGGAVGAINDAVALGSGGLGYIRLANGNVFLGSGSLGYISGQQRSQLLQDQRTRVGAPMPDALHFGHGALGGGFRYK